MYTAVYKAVHTLFEKGQKQHNIIYCNCMLMCRTVPHWLWRALEAATQCLVTIRRRVLSLSMQLYDPFNGGKSSPLDKLKSRQHMREDGLVRSKWPQGSHFPQCSNSPGSLVSICPLWAKVSETHCGHHGLEEIWQIQKTDPVCFSPLREERLAHWYCLSIAVKDTFGLFTALSN